MRSVAEGRYERAERCIDIMIAATTLPVTVSLQLAALVCGALGRPILFRQPQLGIRGAPFTLIKFRTILTLDLHNGAMVGAKRMTRVGAQRERFTSNALPVLWNARREDRSLVSPRPLLMHYLPRCSPPQVHCQDVRPRITGLAQVCGLNALTSEQKFAVDPNYIQRRGVALEFVILSRTIRSVITSKAISASDRPAIPKVYRSSDPNNQQP